MQEENGHTITEGTLYLGHVRLDTYIVQYTRGKWTHNNRRNSFLLIRQIRDIVHYARGKWTHDNRRNSLLTSDWIRTLYNMQEENGHTITEETLYLGHVRLDTYIVQYTRGKWTHDNRRNSFLLIRQIRDIVHYARGKWTHDNRRNSLLGKRQIRYVHFTICKRKMDTR